MLLCGSGSKNVLKTDPPIWIRIHNTAFYSRIRIFFFFWIRSKFFLSLFGFIHKIPIRSYFNSTGTNIYMVTVASPSRGQNHLISPAVYLSIMCLQRPAVALPRMARRLSPRMPASFRSVYTSTLILSSVASCHSRYLFKFLFLKRLLVQ